MSESAALPLPFWGRVALSAVGSLAFAAALIAGEPGNGTQSVSAAIRLGKPSLQIRARYEGVEQTGLRDATALTLRTRFGFTTAEWRGWKAIVEAENVIAADGDSYSQAGLNPGGAGRAVIADPEGTEINQASLTVASGQTTATLGRQRLVLDNARFVGDVGWRQNQQTFDALSLRSKALPQTTVTYAYLSQINRVFGDRHPLGDWESASHVVHAAYAGLPAETVAAYAYLLDFDNAAASSCATYGISFAGTRQVTKAHKLAYRAEFAVQSDYGANPADYSAEYYVIEAGVNAKLGSLSLGHEVLGSDSGVGFKTPLATLHAFNGWTDLFLTTPGNGLRDTYLTTTATLPGELAFIGRYHDFRAERLSAGYGSEVDLQLSRAFGKQVTGLVKYARFERDLASLPDVTKLWIQVEYNY